MSSVKYQVCRLIRMLVHICKTLDSMPAEVCSAFTAASHTLSFASVDASTVSSCFPTVVKLIFATEEADANAAEVLIYEAHIP